MNAEKWVQLLVAHADQLRDVGVLHLKAEGFEAHLAPSIEMPEAGSLGKESQGPDPLNDPVTFGGFLPQFPRDTDQ